tara:strand:- start:720 stop:1013 length:294 start_codon:yes stop_codon:yes gene_type:complete
METLSRRLEFGKHGQIVFCFGDNWSLSVINRGYGASEGLFEIAPMVGGDIEFVEGVSTEFDNVRGYLTEEQVFEYVDKMEKITDHAAVLSDSNLPYW